MSPWDIVLIATALLLLLLVVLFPSKLGFNCWRARRWGGARRRGKGEGPQDYGFRL